MNKTTVFQPYDIGNSEKELHAHAGQAPITVEAMDPAEYDAEVGPMFRITFADGFVAEAFGDELK